LAARLIQLVRGALSLQLPCAADGAVTAIEIGRPPST